MAKVNELAESLTFLPKQRHEDHSVSVSMINPQFRRSFKQKAQFYTTKRIL